MDAADPRIDYLSGTDSNGNDLVYGALLGSKRNLLLIRAGDSIIYNTKCPTVSYQSLDL